MKLEVSAGSNMFFINKQKILIFSSANYLYSYKKWDGYGCRHCFCLDESVGPYRVVKYPSLSEVLVPVCKMIRFPQVFSP